MSDHSNFHSSDLFNERLRPLRNDSSSDSSSLFDEGSSCSTESTRDSTSTEEYWERMSGESDSVNLNSPLRVLEESDGFTRSPLSSRHSAKAVLSGSMPDHHRDDDSECIANSSGREINQVEAERPGCVKHHSDESRSFLYPDKKEHCRNLIEQCRDIETGWINPNEVKSGILLRRPSRERTARTFYWFVWVVEKMNNRLYFAQGKGNRKRKEKNRYFIYWWVSLLVVHVQLLSEISLGPGNGSDLLSSSVLYVS